MAHLRLGFLASHNGSNMQAIIDACNNGILDATPCVVISNNSSSGALIRARNEGIPAYHISSKTHYDEETAIIDALLENSVDILILAGYMKIVRKRTIRFMKGKILNIHPALLPNYGGKGMYGMKVHEAVIAAKEKVSGATVHLVDTRYDHGKILNQKIIKVHPGDTPEQLEAKILQIEHILYTETLIKISNGEILL